jgi:hypothetical protein
MREPTELLPKRKNANLSAAMKGNKNPMRHGHTNGLTYTPTYHSWQAMRARCRYVLRDCHKRYVGRGINLCSEWLNFENFLRDMGERPSGTTLERINNDLGYGPGNCKWATPTEQARNTRRSKLNFGQAVEVATLRLLGFKCREIAERFGISESLPREIVKGRTWPDALAKAKEDLGR